MAHKEDDVWLDVTQFMNVDLQGFKDLQQHLYEPNEIFCEHGLRQQLSVSTTS